MELIISLCVALSLSVSDRGGRPKNIWLVTDEVHCERCCAYFLDRLQRPSLFRSRPPLLELLVPNPLRFNRSPANPLTE